MEISLLVDTAGQDVVLVDTVDADVVYSVFCNDSTIT